MLDDEESVRNEINAKIGDNGADIHCEEAEGGRSQYCERKSSELILGLFLTTFGRDHVNEALVLIVGLILRDDYQISVTDAEDVRFKRLNVIRVTNYHGEQQKGRAPNDVLYFVLSERGGVSF